MTAGQGQPAFGLSFDPRALTDLLQAPSDIRDLTLAYLQEVVNAQRFGLRLDGDLEGCRKLFVDKEIHVVAIRPRAGNDVYDEVGRRLGMTRRPLSARTHAARSRSPQLAARAPVPRPGPPPTAPPGLPRPAPNPAHHPTR
jgi:hypothetical protein